MKQDGPGPHVFALPPGVDFGARFMDGLRARMTDAAPAEWARAEIYVNTERTRRRIEALFETGPVALLPRIRVFADLLPAGGNTLAQRLDLARLVRALIDREPDLAARTAAFDLADGLLRLSGEMQEEGLSWAALDRIDPGDLSGHWQRSLRFLQLIAPVLDAPDAGEGEAGLRRAMLDQVAAWQADPPDHPVIVAGSTGSRGATAAFMAAAARLPKGAVVLPGFDTDLPAKTWARLTDPQPQPDHPQFGFAVLAQKIGVDPASIPLWDNAAAPAPGRNAVISLALRPAPVTDQWLQEGAAHAPTLTAATAKLSLLEAPGARAEAQAIAARLRQAAEDGQRAALVTPDRVLARRVTAALGRWGITPDDSAGRPLSLTPPGVYLRLVLDLIGHPPAPAALLALLKHPLTAAPMRGPHMTATRALELSVLRGGAPVADWPVITAWATEHDHGDWAAWLHQTIAPLAEAPQAVPLPDHLSRHIAAAEALVAGPDGSTSELWAQRAGEAALSLTEALAEAAPSGGLLDLAEYRALITALLSEQNVEEEAFATHPDIAIWGPLEARTQNAELVILGGLNEGVWPHIARPDPWLNREMRASLGLHLPERRIGLSAHDVQQAMGASEVVLTRAIRDADAPTVPTRWLLRLTNLIAGLGEPGQQALDAMRQRGDAMTALARRLDMPTRQAPPAPRPAPCPPMTARPPRLSATRIETLIRDPYAIYAQYILRLRPLDPLGRSPDMRERGTISHKVLERFIAATATGLPIDAAALFDKIAQEVLTQDAPWPADRILWLARLRAFRDWFLDTEAQRRQIATPRVQEVKGGMDLPDLPQPFRLTATADRIDVTPDGHPVIYDYKGTPDSPAQILHFAQQLPLECLIAHFGGFPDIPAAAPAAAELIGMSGGGRSLQMDRVIAEAPDVDDMDGFLSQTYERLSALITAYQQPDQPFAARLRPETLSYESDYDHLSRLGEWEDGAPFDPQGVT